jgi:hypothetical protein
MSYVVEHYDNKYNRWWTNYFETANDATDSVLVLLDKPTTGKVTVFKE